MVSNLWLLNLNKSRLLHSVSFFKRNGCLVVTDVILNQRYIKNGHVDLLTQMWATFRVQFDKNNLCKSMDSRLHLRSVVHDGNQNKCKSFGKLSRQRFIKSAKG